MKTILLFNLSIFFVSSILNASQETHIRSDFQVYLWPGNPPAGIQTLQPKSNEPSKEAANVNLMMRSSPIPLIEYASPKQNNQTRIDAAQNRLSPLYQYNGPNPLVFFQGEAGSRRVIGTIQMPDCKRVLLIFKPNSQTGTYDIHALDNSNENIKKGQALVCNLTQTNIACMFNRQLKKLTPGSSEIANLGPAIDFTATVQIASADTSGVWKERYAQRLIVRPNDSIIAIIYTPQTQENEFRILTIRNPEGIANAP